MKPKEQAGATKSKEPKDKTLRGKGLRARLKSPLEKIIPQESRKDGYVNSQHPFASETSRGSSSRHKDSDTHMVLIRLILLARGRYWTHAARVLFVTYCPLFRYGCVEPTKDKVSGLYAAIADLEPLVVSLK
jgi:hypothetical protein